MPDPQQTWAALTPATSQVLLCDLQEGIVARSRTTSPEALSQSAEVLCKIAELFAIPLTVSVVPEGERAPKLIAPLQQYAPDKKHFLRASASPFFDPATREQLASLGRPCLIVSGFAAEIVVLHAALDALRQGYSVVIAVDACGGLSERTESAALAQIRDGGGIVSSVVSIATALNPDFTTTQGKRMFQILQTLRLG